MFSVEFQSVALPPSLTDAPFKNPVIICILSILFNALSHVAQLVGGRVKFFMTPRTRAFLERVERTKLCQHKL
jgi:hypothetical protein